ncbi:MAG: EamA/RhaT family transporter, partial [Pseudomonadota bacterium]
LGAAGQIFATVAVVALFGLRAFAVGLTFKKSEVLQTAFLGWLVLGDAVSAAGFAALMLGLVALLVLSAPPADTPRSDAVRAVVLGLASGAFFAVAGVGFRAATQEVAGPPLLQAGMALAVATTLQTLLMGGWFALRDRAEAVRVFAAWRPGLIVAGTSLAGSMGWFLAFTGQSAAYVFALGQIELVFALLIGLFVFGERPARRELAGMALLVSSLILLVAVI